MSKEIRNLGLILVSVLVASFVLYKFVFSTETANPIQTENKIVPQVSMISNLAAQHSFSSGPIDAKVTVVEFFDPECESCAAVAPYIKKEMKYYEGKVRWVFRYMPYHFNSKTAIKALEAARKQNKYLEAMTILFENQKIWGEKQISTETEILSILSGVKNLNMNQLKTDMLDSPLNDIINLDESEGKQAGVKGTPSFFVNGVQLEKLDLDLLIKTINEKL